LLFFGRLKLNLKAIKIEEKEFSGCRKKLYSADQKSGLQMMFFSGFLHSARKALFHELLSS
jgi:hypothetical protein